MTEPISLMDLRRRTKLFELGDGQTLRIMGLTAREICDHLERFPLLRTVSIGGDLTPAGAITGTPGALAAWVASACGMHANDVGEQIANEHLTIDESTEIAEESLKLTFTKGFGPFSRRLAALLGYITVGAGREPGTRSPPPSRPAEPQPTTEPGTSPPDSSPPSSSSTSAAASAPAPT